MANGPDMNASAALRGRTRSSAKTWTGSALPWGAFLGLFAALLLSIPAACAVGPLDIGLAQVFQALLDLFRAAPLTDETTRVVVLDLRLSRTLLAAAVGAGLAVSGAVFQGILQNPLADPFTVGVSTGAAFGAAMAIFLGLSAGAVGLLAPGLLDLGVLPLAALAGGLAALATVMALGRSGGTLRRETLVLAGIVVSTFLSALIALLKALDEESVTSIVFWIMGSFQGRGWAHLLLYLPWFLLGSALVALRSRELDILSLGEVQARQLGVDAAASRTLLLAAASLITAASVAVGGVIGFAGLVVPHVVRLVIGGEHRPLLVFSALAGAIGLVWADTLARSILNGGAELPVGVVTALLGGPFFALLLRRRAREWRP